MKRPLSSMGNRALWLVPSASDTQKVSDMRNYELELVGTEEIVDGSNPSCRVAGCTLLAERPQCFTGMVHIFESTMIYICN